MKYKPVLVMLLLIGLMLPTVIADSDENAQMEAQLERVFQFVGLNDPQVSVEDDNVIVELNLPSTYTEEGTLSYIIINAASIAPHTNEIIVRITSDLDAGVEAKAETQAALDYSDGKVTEDEFNSAISLKRIQSATDLFFTLVALVVIIAVLYKLFHAAHINEQHRQLHHDHPVHHYVKNDSPAKKKSAKKSSKKKAKKKKSKK